MSRGLGAELWRAQQAHRGALYAALADVGLTPPQYAALTLVRGTPGISSAELARQAYVSAQTMQAIVASLERRGLLERHAQPAGRILAAWLTVDGQVLQDAAVCRARDVERSMTADLSAAERRQLQRLLVRCAISLEAPAPRGAASVACGKEDS
jgi:DNA-binding MarR family transcriptional regulator